MTRQRIITIARIESSHESQRETAAYAARPDFTSEDEQTQINELVARMEVAKLNRNRSQWDAARTELAALLKGN